MANDHAPSEQRHRSISTNSSTRSATQRLKPATPDERHRHLIVTLSVVSPLLTDEQKLDWIRTVSSDLRDIPENLLAIGCKEARMSCSFPGQIVPKILDTVRPTLASLNRMANEEQNRIPRKRRIQPHYVEPHDAADILERHGLPIPQTLKRQPLRVPTPEDYRSMGIDVPDNPPEGDL